MKYSKIYFIGIKGVGMAALAVFCRQAGFAVSGCDVETEFITDSELSGEKIPIDVGFEEENLKQFVHDVQKEEVLIIVTAAHGGLSNPLAQYAAQLNIKTVPYAQALGMAMEGPFTNSQYQGISIAGAHGKTTITALFAVMLSQLGFDPSYIVGTSSIIPLGAAGHFGRGEYFVAEADEYVSDMRHDNVPKFFYHTTNVAVLNNIDFDHPDYYKTIEDVQNAYKTFLENVKSGGIIIANGDDIRIEKLLTDVKQEMRIIRYGVRSHNDYFISSFRQDGMNSTFTVETPEMNLGEFTMSVPGYHNAKNTLPVIAFLIEKGVDISKIKKALPVFRGSKRRFEVVGKTQHGAVVIDDYAHHPDEIKTTLAAVKAVFPTKHIIAIFEPHTASRTKSLLNEFVASFTDAARVIALPTYLSARETESSVDLDQEFAHQFNLIQKPFFEAKTPSDVVKYITSHYASDENVIITMGAGKVYIIAYELVARSS